MRCFFFTLLVSTDPSRVLTPRVVTRRNAGVRGWGGGWLHGEARATARNRPAESTMLDHGAAVRHGGRAKTLATHLRGRDGQTTLDGDAAATPASCEHSTVRRLAPSCLLRGSPVALGGSTLPGAEAGPRDAATASGAAQDAVDYLQESSRNHVRGHNRAQSARSKAPVVMAEPHHVFRSFPTTQVVWYTACKHAILMCVLY